MSCLGVLNMARISRTGRAAATYILLAALQRGVSLLILPFITHAMEPAEYGAASMLTATAMLLTSVLAAPLIQMIVRAAARGDENGPALLRAAGVYCYLLLPVVIACVALVFAIFVRELLGVSGRIWAVELLAIGLQPAAGVFAMWVAQAREDLNRFTYLAAVSVIATALSKAVLVVILKMGLLGWVLSDLLSAILTALLAFYLVRLPRVRIQSDHLRYALTFTVPLIPHTAALWAVSSLSRPAMAAVSTLEQVGLLSFGLNLALVANLVLTEVNRAVLPRYSRESFRAPTRETLAPVAWQLIAAFAVPAFVGAGVTVTGRWLFAEAYWPSFTLTGILLVGQAAYGFYLIPMNYLTQTAGKPKFSALASGAGALLILVAILVVGKRFGGEGVAYATALGYLAMAVVALGITRAHKLAIAWRAWCVIWRELSIAFVALALSVVGLALPAGSRAGWATSAACIGLILLAAFMTNRLRTA